MTCLVDNLLTIYSPTNTYDGVSRTVLYTNFLAGFVNAFNRRNSIVNVTSSGGIELETVISFDEPDDSPRRLLRERGPGGGLVGSSTFGVCESRLVVFCGHCPVMLYELKEFGKYNSSHLNKEVSKHLNNTVRFRKKRLREKRIWRTVTGRLTYIS